MRVLIGCEYSGVIRDAFIAQGHDAMSADLLPTESPGPHHQGDMFDIVNGGGWDLAIFHPPCTFLSYAATSSWNAPGRAEKREAAYEFFMRCYNAPIPRVVVENPVGWPNVKFRKPDQIIHPYYFGDVHMKKTCLWLRRVPPLIYTLADDLFGPATAVEKPAPIYVDRKVRADRPTPKKRYFTDSHSGGEGHARSKSFTGIANAMALQWGRLNVKK